jgi:hypothetical protein
MCWPETKVNTTAYLDCPDYINKFVKKSILFWSLVEVEYFKFFFHFEDKVNKTCYFNITVNRAVWSKTHMNYCYPPSDTVDWKNLAVCN